MSVKLVMFDLGGVLVKIAPEKFLAKLAEATGKSVESLKPSVEDRKLIESLELGYINPRVFYEQVKERTGVGWTYEQFVKAWNSIIVDENSDTTWVLDRLRTQYKLLVLTNTDPVHDTYIRNMWPVFQFIPHWVASYVVGFRKPDPRIFELALREADVQPRETVYIDDLAEHIETARHLGIPAIHFTDGLVLEHELKALGVHV
jgi:putative hydrolase of the HAD superfamily